MRGRASAPSRALSGLSYRTTFRSMFRPLVLAALTFVGLSAVAHGQAAPPVPACPNSEDKLTTYTPGYGKPSQSGVYGLELANESGAEQITNATVTLIPGTGPASPTVVTIQGDETKVILAAPASGDHFGVQFDWDQDVGTAAACHGRDVFGLPLLPTRAKVGDPFAARLEGTYRMRSTPVNYSAKVARSKWTIRPRCDYFACSARLRSNRGLRGTLRVRDNGSYRLTGRYRDPSSCVVTVTTTDSVTGEVLTRRSRTIRHAYRGSTRLSLRVRKVKDGRALIISGSHTDTATPTARARSKGCKKASVYRQHVTGRALG
jgi:hypothetical protein